MSHRELAVTTYIVVFSSPGFRIVIHWSSFKMLLVVDLITGLHIWQDILKPVRVHELGDVFFFHENREEPYYLIYVLILSHHSVQHNSV